MELRKLLRIKGSSNYGNVAKMENENQKKKETRLKMLDKYETKKHCQAQLMFEETLASTKQWVTYI